MNKKIHVLQVIGAMNRGGAEVMIMDVFRNLSQNTAFSFLINYKIKIGIPKGDFDTEIIAKGAKLRHIGAQWDIGPIKYIKEFKRIYNELGQPEVVHIHLNAKCGIIALAAKVAGAKVIIAHSHGDIAFKDSFMKNFFAKIELKFQKILISKFANNFWSCSELAAKSLFYKKIINNGHAVIINNAIDVDSFINISMEDTQVIKEELNIDNNIMVLGVVGRIVKRKNMLFIIDVLNHLQKINIDFVFISVGKVKDKSYMSMIDNKVKECKLENKVIHYGLSDNIPLMMSIFDVFISPAHNEAFGMVAAEAQASGLPCILSSEFPNSIDMQLGLVSFIENFDTEIWANEIERVKYLKCTNKKLIKKKFSKLGFDIKSSVKQIEKLYNDNKY